jgi:hypothetical protein
VGVGNWNLEEVSGKKASTPIALPDFYGEIEPQLSWKQKNPKVQVV